MQSFFDFEVSNVNQILAKATDQNQLNKQFESKLLFLEFHLKSGHSLSGAPIGFKVSANDNFLLITSSARKPGESLTVIKPDQIVAAVFLDSSMAQTFFSQEGVVEPYDQTQVPTNLELKKNISILDGMSSLIKCSDQLIASVESLKSEREKFFFNKNLLNLREALERLFSDEVAREQIEKLNSFVIRASEKFFVDLEGDSLSINLQQAPNSSLSVIKIITEVESNL